MENPESKALNLPWAAQNSFSFPSLISLFLTALFNNRHTAITDTHSIHSSLTSICHLTTDITIYYL